MFYSSGHDFQKYLVLEMSEQTVCNNKDIDINTAFHNQVYAHVLMQYKGSTTLSMMAISIVTHGIMNHGIMTFSIMPVNITKNKKRYLA
jgi:hypothetical protein